MSAFWIQPDSRCARRAWPSSALSRSLAKMLVGAAIGTMPSPALASDGGLKAAATPSSTQVAQVAQDRTAFVLPVAESTEQRTYGPMRPGLGTPTNTMAPGEISVETGFIDWQRDDTNGIRSDTLLFGATTIRVGVGRSVETIVSWVPFGHVRVRDETGAVERADRVGDALVGFKANLINPDGSGLSAAIQPFASLPVGRTPVGLGDWGAGVVAPISYDLSKTVNIAVTGEVDAATNSGAKGRHLSYSVVGGVSLAVTTVVKVTGELSGRRDDDPDGCITQAFASVAAAWSARTTLQFDIGAAAGLNHDSPDVRLYGGISRRF